MATVLDIFDVGHGQCAMLSGDNGVRILIDCGHSAGPDGWSPANHLKSLGIRQVDALIVTNYDEDHMSGLPALRRSGVTIRQLWRNTSVSADTIRTLKTEDGMGPGIDALCDMIRQYTSDVSAADKVLIPGVEWRTFRNSYPAFNDENNLSMALYLNLHGKGSYSLEILRPPAGRSYLRTAIFRRSCPTSLSCLRAITGVKAENAKSFLANIAVRRTGS